MSGERIGLFAERGSAQLEALRDELAQLGAEPLMFDIQLAGESASRVSYGADGASWGGVDFGDIRAAHIRCTAPKTHPMLPPVLNAASYNEMRSEYLREQECSAVTYGFFEHLAEHGVLVINPLTSAYLDHNAKGQLYCKLRAGGFPAPRTLVTSDPNEAAAFLDEVPEAVVKPAIGVGSTRLFREADRKRIEEFGYCPVLMQERIRGNTVRVHIVGDTVVLALEVKTDDEIDSRTFTQGFEYLELPRATQEAIVAANRSLGLHYAAWDIIGAGESYHFLDCNPGPYIMWIGPAFVRVVLHELAKYLLKYAQTGSVDEASAAVRAWSPDGQGRPR